MWRAHPPLRGSATSGIWQNAEGTARRRQHPQSAVQDVIVNLLCPISIPLRVWKALPVSWTSPRLVPQNSSALHMIMCEADRVHHAAREPNRRVIPERLLNIDPYTRALASFGEELHRRRVL